MRLARTEGLYSGQQIVVRRLGKPGLVRNVEIDVNEPRSPALQPVVRSAVDLD